jgi:hypothetical protein
MIPFSPLVTFFRLGYAESAIHLVTGFISILLDFLLHCAIYAFNIIFYAFMIAVVTHNIDGFANTFKWAIHWFASGALPVVSVLVDIGMSACVGFLVTSYVWLIWRNIVAAWWRTPERRMIIVRGVPGIGKHSYVDWRELHDDYRGKYAICDWSNTFNKWNKETEIIEYEYDALRSREADYLLFTRSARAVGRGMNRIYVVHTFEKKWMYEPFVSLAKSNGYQVEIVELVCNNKRELRHFNQRSTHSVPLKKSVRVFSNWQRDSRAILQEPYLEPEIGQNGDSIPLHLSNRKEREEFKERLDVELDNYFKRHPSNHTNRKSRKVAPVLNEYSHLIIPRITSRDSWFARRRVDMTF